MWARPFAYRESEARLGRLHQTVGVGLNNGSTLLALLARNAWLRFRLDAFSLRILRQMSGLVPMRLGWPSNGIAERRQHPYSTSTDTPAWARSGAARPPEAVVGIVIAFIWWDVGAGGR